MKTGNTRVVVVGYYGMKNYGDDLFGEAVLQNCEKLFPGAEVRVARPDAAPRLASKSRSRASVLFASTMSSVRRLLAGLSDAVWADVIVLGGGSVLEDVRGVRAVQQFLTPVLRTRFSGIGVSVGPFSDAGSETRVVKFLQQFDTLIVRDQASLRWLATHKWHRMQYGYGGDLAALYAADAVGPKRSTTRDLGISLCNYRGSSWAAVERLLAGIVSGAQAVAEPSKSDKFVLFSLSSHPLWGDRDLSRRAAIYLKSRGCEVEIVEYDSNSVSVSDIWYRIARLDILVAVRLHAAITAYLSSVPFLMVSYHQKCSEFAADIGLNPLQLLASDERSDVVASSVGKLLSEPVGPKTDALTYRSNARTAYMKGEGLD